MARKFGSIKPTTAGNWVGRYRIKGKDYYTSVQRTKSEVEADLRRVQRSIKEGDWQPPAPGTRKARTKPLTLEEWGEAWLEQCEQEGKSPNTLRVYASRVRKHITPRIGRLALKDITPKDITRFQSQLQADLTPGHTRVIILTLSAMLSSAVARGLIKSNPAAGMAGLFARPKGKTKAIAITADQLNQIIQTADDDMRAAFALAGWGALRYGEIAALQRRDINIDQGTVTVTKSVARDPKGKLVVKGPKSQAGYRTVSLPPTAVQTVKEHLDAYTRPEPEAQVFTRRSGNPGFIQDRAFRDHLHQVCTQLGLPRLRFHDLRHTGLTLYGQAGATLADLMHRAGHSDVSTVMIYQHSSLQRDAELAQRMG